jgi:SopA-like catalytic domain
LTCKTLTPEADGLYQHRIALADDILLTPHLMHFCEAEPQSKHFKISMEHTSRLWRIFNNTSAPLTDNAANRARMLLCLGTLFVRYSSAALFGTEEDSLISVREYARACLKRAHALDTWLLGRCATKIEDALLGVPGAGQCTDNLAITLSAFIRDRTPYDPTLKTCFTAIYPRAWE